jgi:hypothetical protein
MTPVIVILRGDTHNYAEDYKNDIKTRWEFHHAPA